MAALYEGYTLCGLVPEQNLSNSGVRGIEQERDSDHVVVTDSTRSVTMYKVSDQKPLGRWTVKQGQSLTCPAVFNPKTKEYVAVSDNQVIRIWKEEDVLLDKTFKATVSSDIWRVHCAHGGDPVVLFQRGAVRLLDSLLSAPQQPIEEILAQEEAIRSTLQAGKEMAGKIYGQLWCYSNKLFIPHGKTLSVIPFVCPKSSLASALGKLKQAKTAPIEAVQKEVEGLLSRSDIQDLQPCVGQLVSILVSRSLADPSFYIPSTLAQLVHTQCLCHSACPDLVLLALEKKDYFLCQLCLQFFPDIPEAVTCACLKAFISLEPDSISFVEALISRERAQVSFQNGYGTTTCEDRSDDPSEGGGIIKEKEKTSAPSEQICPVGLHKAVLLNEVLQTAYSETFLLPHLKDLSSQHVVLFLQYLQFLYLKYSQDDFPQMHGLRSPSLTQIMDWVCLVLDAHFTMLVMIPEAKGLLLNLHSFVKSQVRLVSELGKIEGSLQELKNMKVKKEVGQYSVEIIELF
uniref:Nucleolar protein 11 n=1 Tax=Echeneis naucrates TaxID=173247 RepID=A0A665VC48_ECHNA